MTRREARELLPVFKKRLVLCRNKKNISQKRLSLLISYSPNAVNQIENTNHLPTFDTIIAIATELDVSTDYLLGLKDE